MDKCEFTKIDYRCSCPKADCPRHGKCCECVAFHRGKDKLPHCLRKE